MEHLSMPKRPLKNYWHKKWHSSVKFGDLTAFCVGKSSLNILYNLHLESYIISSSYACSHVFFQCMFSCLSSTFAHFRSLGHFPPELHENGTNCFAMLCFVPGISFFFMKLPILFPFSEYEAWLPTLSPGETPKFKVKISFRDLELWKVGVLNLSRNLRHFKTLNR